MQRVILTKKHCFQKKMFKMNDIMIKKTQGKQQVEQPFIGQ